VDLKGLKSDSTSIPSQKDKQKKQSKSVWIAVGILSITVLMVVGYLLIQPGKSGESGWENSIAVLPFEDMSPAKDQEWFCDGMTEQVISNLGRLRNLKVTARQSVMKYKDSKKTIHEIGKDLNVAHVLESSIRKSGNRIRVTAQLIKTDDGFHLWSQDFDRNLDDIFDIQDDISEKIATALLTTLSSEEKKEIKTNRPKNTKAYEYYVKGKYFHYNKFFSSRNVDDCKTSEKMFKEAIKYDNTFAGSYASLADLYNTFYSWLPDTVSIKNTLLQLQETYIDTAFQLNPNSAECYFAKSWIDEAKGEIDDAIKSAKKMLKINKNYNMGYWTLGMLLGQRGLKNISINCFSLAIDINPLWWRNYADRANEYLSIESSSKS